MLRVMAVPNGPVGRLHHIFVEKVGSDKPVGTFHRARQHVYTTYFFPIFVYGFHLGILGIICQHIEAITLINLDFAMVKLKYRRISERSVMPQCSAETVPPSKVAPLMLNSVDRNISTTSFVVELRSSIHSTNTASDIGACRSVTLSL